MEQKISKFTRHGETNNIQIARKESFFLDLWTPAISGHVGIYLDIL